MVAAVNAFLLAWPFVPLVLLALLGPYIVMAPSSRAPEWRLVVLHLASLEKELHCGLETALAALKAARQEADSPADQWLRQQLEGLGD